MNSSRYHDGGGGQLVNSFRNDNDEGTGTEQGRNRDGTGTPTKTFLLFQLRRKAISYI